MIVFCSTTTPLPWKQCIVGKIRHFRTCVVRVHYGIAGKVKLLKQSWEVLKKLNFKNIQVCCLSASK